MTFKAIQTERGYEVGEYDAKTGVIELEQNAATFPSLAAAKRYAVYLQQIEQQQDHSYALGYAPRGWGWVD